jgi:hypothetical protein
LERLYHDYEVDRIKRLGTDATPKRLRYKQFLAA